MFSVSEEWHGRPPTQRVYQFAITYSKERVVDLLRSVAAHIEALGRVNVVSVVVTSSWGDDRMESTARVTWTELQD